MFLVLTLIPETRKFEFMELDSTVGVSVEGDISFCDIAQVISARLSESLWRHVISLSVLLPFIFS